MVKIGQILAKQYRNKKIYNSLASRFGASFIRQMNVDQRYILFEISAALDALNDEIDIVYDIGANDGSWSQAFALYTNQNVYAFEPLPNMITVLKKRSQKIPLIHVQPVACGLNSGQYVINSNDFSPSSSLLSMTELHIQEWEFTKVSHPVMVEVVTLDDWRMQHALPYPSLIKIDVQGYENEVLEGAMETLNYTKYLWIELNFKDFYKGGSTFDSVYRKATDLGFELIDCMGLARSPKTNQLLHMDGLFKRIK